MFANTLYAISLPSSKLTYANDNMPLGYARQFPKHLGSASTATSANGLVSWRQQYKPFGETMNTLPVGDDLDGFTGHIKDSATGLNYMQARYYDPIIGRFLSIDPINFTPETPQMFGRYTYVNNDPVNGVDPSGLAACPADDKNCIDDPKTETGDEEQPGPSEEQQEIDEIIVTAQRIKKFSDGTKIKFPISESSDLEQGFRVDPNGILEQKFTVKGTQKCDDGSSRAANKINVGGLGANQSVGHTHGGGGLDPLPGPEDGLVAAATGRTAYMISRRGAFAIESTRVGFRVRQIGGRRLRGKERKSVQNTIAKFNQNNGGSGRKCTFTAN